MIISSIEIEKNFLILLKAKQMFDKIKINKLNKIVDLFIKIFYNNLRKDLYKTIKKIYNNKSRKDVQNGKNSM